MARDAFQVTAIRDLKVETINNLVSEINTALTTISQRFAEVRGTDGNTPKLDNHLDMNEKEVQNVKKITFTQSALLTRTKRLLASGQQAGSFNVTGAADANAALVNAALDEIVGSYSELVKILQDRGVLS